VAFKNFLNVCKTKFLALSRWKQSLILLLVAAVGAWFFRGPILRLIEPPPKPNAVVFIGGTKDISRRGDIVFVHGIDGDAWDTWGDKDAAFYWPTWLAKRLPDTGVWSLDYDAASSRWSGDPMRVNDRSENLLDQMRLKGIGKRPIIFICHSLGGIMVKRMLQDGATLQNEKYEIIFSQTKGVFFLATPHGGSDATTLAEIFRLYRRTDLLQDLTLDNDSLRKLNRWYSNTAPIHEIATSVYVEGRDYPGIGRIVTPGASDPGITGVFPVEVDADHIAICKPTSEDSHVCEGVLDFILENMTPTAEPSAITLTQFMSDLKPIRDNGDDVSAFVKVYANQRFTSDVFVREIYPQQPHDLRSQSAYLISIEKDAPGEDWISARFPRYDSSFDPRVRPGTGVKISGILEDKRTNRSGVFLKECELRAVLPTPRN
jgi:hypothetical protein